MSAIEDFEIENGLLKKYRGTERDVVIPEGVTSIGSAVFFNCKSLRSVEIPEGVTSIGNHVFRGCSRLTAVRIPAVVTSISEFAFSKCASLAQVEIPAGVTSIGYSAFSGCTGLTALEIPAGVRFIGCFAFLDCTRLTEITLPGSLEEIIRLAFSGCHNLENIWVEGTDADVERIRELLPEEFRSKVHSELRRAWLFSVAAVATEKAESISFAGAQEHPSKKVKQLPEDACLPTSIPFLATLLSDGMRMSIPPAAVAVDEAGAEASSHQVVSEYAVIVASFL